MSMEQRVRMLEDLEEIRLLKSRYFRFVDLKRWTELRGLFTDDCTFEGLWAVGDGVEAFMANISRNLDGVLSVHHGYMPDLAITGADTASGTWTMTDRLLWEPDSRAYLGVGVPGQRGINGYGYYEETYQRTAKGWQISSMRLSRLTIEPITDPEPPTLTGWLPAT